MKTLQGKNTFFTETVTKNVSVLQRSPRSKKEEKKKKRQMFCHVTVSIFPLVLSRILDISCAVDTYRALLFQKMLFCIAESV